MMRDDFRRHKTGYRGLMLVVSFENAICMLFLTPSLSIYLDVLQSDIGI